MFSRQKKSKIAAQVRFDNPDNNYVAYHAKRYALIIALLNNYLGKYKKNAIKILDIGRSPLTRFIAVTLNLQVDSLGLGRDSITETGSHYHLDLNSVQQRIWRRDLPKYDVVIMAEVIEHLHTSPALVLEFLKTIMRPAGLLIIQTPNAAVLHKRLMLLFGRNPYWLIKEEATNPGHFREYTKKEICNYAAKAGFMIEECFFGNYFDYRFSEGVSGRSCRQPWCFGLVNLIYDLVPVGMRPGITAVLRLPKPL